MITTILVVMGVMALITHAIGVHTVLGAFVAGILVGESPILTRHIDEQLRGLIVALFMPVFFGLAGLSADLSILKNPRPPASDARADRRSRASASSPAPSRAGGSAASRAPSRSRSPAA